MSGDSDSEDEYVVEGIKNVRMQRNKLQYEIKWLGYDDPDEDCWTNEEDCACQEKIDDFWKNGIEKVTSRRLMGSGKVQFQLKIKGTEDGEYFSQWIDENKCLCIDQIEDFKIRLEKKQKRRNGNASDATNDVDSASEAAKEKHVQSDSESSDAGGARRTRRRKTPTKTPEQKAADAKRATLRAPRKSRLVDESSDASDSDTSGHKKRTRATRKRTMKEKSVSPDRKRRGKAPAVEALSSSEDDDEEIQAKKKGKKTSSESLSKSKKAAGDGSESDSSSDDESEKPKKRSSPEKKTRSASSKAATPSKDAETEEKDDESPAKTTSESPIKDLFDQTKTKVKRQIVEMAEKEDNEIHEDGFYAIENGSEVKSVVGINRKADELRVAVVYEDSKTQLVPIRLVEKHAVEKLLEFYKDYVSKH